MEISQDTYFMLILYSFALGVFLGVAYDIIRVLRIALIPKVEKQSKFRLFDFVFTFLTDIIFSIAAAFSVIVLVYYINYGIVRWFVLLFAGVGFLIYYNTVGRIVIICAEKIILFFRMTVIIIIRITLYPIFFLFMLIFSAIYVRIKMNNYRCRAVRIHKNALKSALKGFV